MVGNRGKSPTEHFFFGRHIGMMRGVYLVLLLVGSILGDEYGDFEPPNDSGVWNIGQVYWDEEVLK
jgi:hypothetical protein